MHRSHDQYCQYRSHDHCQYRSHDQYCQIHVHVSEARMLKISTKLPQSLVAFKYIYNVDLLFSMLCMYKTMH